MNSFASGERKRCLFACCHANAPLQAYKLATHYRSGHKIMVNSISNSYKIKDD